MKVGKSLPALGAQGATIVAAGGYTNSNSVTSDTELYTIAKNTWKTIAPMPTARQSVCTAPIKGHLYVAGGSNGAPVSVLEAYGGSPKAWTTLAPIPQAVVAPGSATSGGRLYCFGRSNDGRIFVGSVFNNVQIYQP